ncbi:MAG: hypothetical protein QOF45_1338 [Gaiellaceae bacterium]|jgi:Tol biopolymer transport system component|nr:hypothetical protein [Gaiellaceae bacterium]
MGEWRLRRSFLVGGMFAAVVVLTLAGGVRSAGAAFPGANGKIVYASDRDAGTGEPAELFAIDPDGSDRVQLTATPGFESSPAWSADGTKLAFARDGDLFVIDADGSDEINVTDSPGSFESYPAWSPDGTRLAFQRENELFSIRVDGTDELQLTDYPPFFVVSDFHPAWSPDGTKIVFASSRDDQLLFRAELYVMNADGSDETRLTDSDGLNDTHPNWSPDGTRIVWAHQPDPGPDQTDIFVMDADGTDQRSVTANPEFDAEPAWSPDGTLIVFRLDDLLYTVRPDGTDQTQLTAGPVPTETSDRDPDWGVAASSVLPVIAGLSPSSGTDAGGTSVTITGSAFTGATAVTFDGDPAASFSVDSATQITAVTPAHAAATVDVAVTTPAGTSSNTGADDFTYTGTPTTTTTTATTTTTPATGGGGLAPADVGVTAQSSAQPAFRGVSFTISIEAVNNGPGPAPGAVVTVSLPAGVELVSTPCIGLLCPLKTLDPGERRLLELVVRAETDVTGTITVSISSDAPDPALGNQRALIAQVVGCAPTFTLGTVTVLATCIEPTPGFASRLRARGAVSFGSGGRIVGPGTDTPLTLVLDRNAGTIGIEGGGRGVLRLGTRDVAAGTFLVETEPVTDPKTGLSQLARVRGVDDIRPRFSGWKLDDDDTRLYLVPTIVGGGALVSGPLEPIAGGLLGLSGELTAQVLPNGRRSVRASVLKADHVGLPGSQWAFRNVVVGYRESGSRTGAVVEEWYGSADFSPFLVKLLTMETTLRDGKLSRLAARFNCLGCEWGAVPGAPEASMFKIKYLRLGGYDLDAIDYTPPNAGSGPGSAALAACIPAVVACPDPPRIEGEIVGAALQKIIGVGKLKWTIGGVLTIRGRAFFAPTLPPSFPVPAWAAGATPYLEYARRGIDIGEAKITIDPPNRFTIEGEFIAVHPGFLRSSFFLGIDPPHFTARGSVDLRIPDSSPLFPGKKVGGVDGLVSDEAAAAQVTFRACAPKWLGGGCTSTWFSAAYKWTSGFRFFENIGNYETVQSSALRRTAAANAAPFAIPTGWSGAAIRVIGVDGVPDVRISSPLVGGRRLVLTRASQPDEGALVSTSTARRELVFLVATPPAGRWDIDELGGSRVASVNVAPIGSEPGLELTGALPARAGTGTGILLSWHASGPDATVDVWAADAESSAPLRKLVEGGAPSGRFTWRPGDLSAGSYTVFATLNLDGIPIATRSWPGELTVSDDAAPAVPGRPTLRRGKQTLVSVSWRGSGPRAATYIVRARPQLAGAAPLAEARVSGSRRRVTMSLPRGRAFLLTVQAADAAGRRSAESRPATLPLRAAAARGLVGTPGPAQAGVAWGFSPRPIGLKGPVRLVLVRGPKGVRATGGALEWLPTEARTGKHVLVVRAVGRRGGRAQASFEVTVTPAMVALGAPATGLAVFPSSIPARETTTVTVHAQALRPGVAVLVDGRPVGSSRLLGSTSVSIELRCLPPGAHTVGLRRPNGTTERLARALLVTGPACGA